MQNDEKSEEGFRLVNLFSHERRPGKKKRSCEEFFGVLRSVVARNILDGILTSHEEASTKSVETTVEHTAKESQSICNLANVELDPCREGPLKRIKLQENVQQYQERFFKVVIQDPQRKDFIKSEALMKLVGNKAHITGLNGDFKTSCKTSFSSSSLKQFLGFKFNAFGKFVELTEEITRQTFMESSNRARSDYMAGKEDVERMDTNPSSEIPSSERCFKVVFAKLSSRKHKRWEDDGYLVDDGSLVTLKVCLHWTGQDTEGNELGVSGIHLNMDMIEDGKVFTVGEKEVQIDEEIFHDPFAKMDCK